MRARGRGAAERHSPQEPQNCLGWRREHKLSPMCPPIYMGKA